MDLKKPPLKTDTEHADELPVAAAGDVPDDAVKKTPRHPLLYQINTRVWLTDLSRKLGRRATLDDIPGSCFAVTGYAVHEALGGDRALGRLRDRHARAVREHFWAEADYRNKSARFLENHDEPRATAVFPDGAHPAAALLTYLCPGLRFFHHGQLEGWDQKIPIHLCRGPDQPDNSTTREFYRQLLDFLNLPAVRNGRWELLNCTVAHDGNQTADDVIAFAWQGSDGARALVVVNYAAHPGQSFVRLPFADLGGQPIRLEGRLGTPSYEREGSRLIAEGLYVDLPPWGYHIFELISAPQS